jgi:tetratricopeptide (TPR) repeat protein
MAENSAAIELEQRGRAALKTESYSEALRNFSEASKMTSDTEVQARLNFRQAVTLQQMAVKSDTGDAQMQLKHAARLFQSFLSTHPDSAAAANNLAKTFEQLGNLIARDSGAGEARRYYEIADQNYQKALAIKDSRQGVYLKNYAEFLEQTGDWEKAKEYYALLIAEHPLSPSLRQTLANSYAVHGSKDFAEYLWHLLDAGYINQTTRFALDSLQKSLNRNDEGRIDLLTIVCVSLAMRSDDYMENLDFRAADPAKSLLNDKLLSQGVQQIVHLHKGIDLNRENYRWWIARGTGLGDPKVGVWPLDGFRALIRSLGSRSKQAGNPQLAEEYFRLAAEIERGSVDPMAVRAMVRMYAEADQFSKIDETLGKYQVRLFKGKSKAYGDSDVARIFLYHQTLGELYALIGRWGDSNTVGSAIFQLEHAQEFSRELGGNSPEKLPEKYQFTPSMVESLASGYEKIGQPIEATKLRINQAEFYKRANDPKAAVRVLAPVKEADLSESYKSRYEILKASPDLNLQLQEMNIKSAVTRDSQGR